MGLAQLAARLSDVTVVVFGDIVADVYWFGETERVSREAPVPVVRHESSEVRLGGAGNVAANAAALGARVRPVGLLGDDAAGGEILNLYAGLGAPTDGIVVVPGRLTETKTRILAGGRSTTRQQMLRVDRADDRPPDVRVRRRLRDALRRACEGAQALVVSDYGSGLVGRALAGEVRALARRIPVCADSRYGIRAFRGVTLAKPNEPELEAAIGRRVRTGAELERAGRLLRRELGVRALLVTRGKLGMTLFEHGRTTSIPAHGPGDAVDVTGAGDTVLAAMAAALAAGAESVDAARLANVAAGVVVQKPGTATCSRAELAAGMADVLDAERAALGGR